MPAQFLRQLLRPYLLTRHPSSSGPIAFHPGQRVPLVVEHPFDFQHRFDVAPNIQPLIPATFLRL